MGLRLRTHAWQQEWVSSNAAWTIQFICISARLGWSPAQCLVFIHESKIPRQRTTISYCSNKQLFGWKKKSNTEVKFVVCNLKNSLIWHTFRFPVSGNLWRGDIMCDRLRVRPCSEEIQGPWWGVYQVILTVLCLTTRCLWKLPKFLFAWRNTSVNPSKTNTNAKMEGILPFVCLYSLPLVHRYYQHSCYISHMCMINGCLTHRTFIYIALKILFLC